MDRKKFAGSCIICIGSTGTGKSTTIQTCTLQGVHTSGGSKSDTFKCEKYGDLRNTGGPIWVDSVGWDDTEGRNDQQSFQEVLKFISSIDCTKISAVIWTINPDIRESQTLQRQADFINQFADGDIWRNVLIIAKSSDKAAQSCQGALAAAKQYSRRIEVMTLSYKYLENADKDQLDKLQNNIDLRQLTNTYTREEVYQQIRSKLDLIEEPVQVVFNDKQCLDCGVEGDERLLPEKCHVQKQMVHEGCLQKLHPGQVENVHILALVKKHGGEVVFESEKTTMFEKGLRKLCAGQKGIKIPILGLTVYFGEDMSGDMETILKKIKDSPDRLKYTCCGSQYKSEGCKTVWKCCGKEEGNPGCDEEYSCCKAKVVEGLNNGCEGIHECCNGPEGSEGCKAICRLCDNPWCDPTTACFKKKHNLVNNSS